MDRRTAPPGEAVPGRLPGGASAAASNDARCDGAESERRDCFDPLDTVRRRDMIGAWEAASVSGVVGALEDAVI